MQPDYAIYPSILAKFQELLDYEKVAEEDGNKVSEASQKRGEYPDCEIGDYKLTPDEMYLKLESELIDTINRVPHAPNEAADKGTAFNEIVDSLIERRRSSRDDCKIYSYRKGDDPIVIRAEINGFVFDYDISLCKDIASRFPGSLTQYFADAVMPTAYGNVRLYGYIDEWVGNRIVDLKTTSRYSWGKFEKGWQRYVYPWCVIESGVATEIESFTYFVVEWAYQAKGKPLTAKGIYEETYTYDHNESARKIREMCERFIEWLDIRREFITDNKIFGGENPEGYEGKPVDRERLEKYLFV